MLSRKQPKYVNALPTYLFVAVPNKLIHNFFFDRFDADIPSSICATPDSESHNCQGIISHGHIFTIQINCPKCSIKMSFCLECVKIMREFLFSSPQKYLIEISISKVSS